MNSSCDYTCWLFPQPSPKYAAGQVLDLFGTRQRYNYSASPEHADELAFLRDWAAIGEDLKRAIAAFEIDLSAGT